MILYISFEEDNRRTYCLYAANNDLEWFQELKRFDSREELLVWLDLNMPGVSSMPMKNVKISWTAYKVYDSAEICMSSIQAESLCRLCLGDNVAQEYFCLNGRLQLIYMKSDLSM